MLSRYTDAQREPGTWAGLEEIISKLSYSPPSVVKTLYYQGGSNWMLMFCAGDGELEVLAEMLNAKIKYWVVPVHTHLRVLSCTMCSTGGVDQ